MINERNGKASMMYYGEKPWHGLGTELKKPATAEEAMKEAQLNFTVEKMPIFFNSPTKKLIEIVDKYATVRTDTNKALGIVGSRYEPVQNSQAFSFFDSLVGEGEAIYHTAGVLGDGERIWLLAKMPDYIKIKGVNGKEDVIEKFVLLTNSHDGSSPTIAKLTPIRVVCNNTLSAALRGTEQEVRIRHTASSEEKLREAHKILGLTNQLYTQLGTIFNSFSNKKVTESQTKKFFEEIMPDNVLAKHNTRTENNRTKLFELYETGMGSEFSKGTVWGLYNAITEYVDHEKYSNKQMKDGDFNKLEKIWFNGGENIKHKAFDMALELVK
jgi:phage/plasmid-like protein (TIGR03299 family)